MSATKHFISGTGTGKSPADNSKFMQTCNRLSLLLRQKRAIRDLNAKLDATGIMKRSSVPEVTTVDLLGSIDDQKTEKSPNTHALPEFVILDSSDDLQNSTKKPKTAQMTIFYGGEVVVLDDVPADRAADLMKMANNGKPVDQKVENRVESSKLKSRSGDAAKDSDLPIARRASLHKFLAKRKDRATVRPPCQPLNHQSPGGSSSGNGYGFDLNT